MLEALQKSVDENNESLQKDIEELSTKVDNMKAELTEAYTKAIEEAINTNNGVIDGKIAEAIAAVNGRIDSEVAAINARISALEERVDDLEQDVEYLLSRIQSISYIPKYSDGRATLRYFQDTGYLNLDFEISPKEILPTLMEVWESTVTIKAVVTETRAVEFITLPIKSFETNLTNGVISLSITGDSLIPLCLAENKSASIAMSISDGNNFVVSEYIPIVLEVAEHIDMWDYFYIYSHWDDTKYVVAYSGGIRFDWYLKKLGGKKADPVAAGTYVVSAWESTTTKDYVDASATKINGVLLQEGGVVNITEVAEGLKFEFDVTDVNGTNWKGTYTGPIDPNLYYNPYAN
jgi:tetrahydromethanopterin S-methyltransferase subunit G